MPDVILLEGIQVPAALGVTAAERRMRRPVTLDLEVEYELRPAGRSDRIGHTLHYKRIFEVVEDVAANQEHKLVEALGERIARAILEKFGAEAVTVTVRKPKPIAGVLEHTGIRKFYNGPESFTPDNQFLLGEAPGLRGYFVGAGFNSVGIASAGGAGRALAEWVVEGSPSMDLTSVDVRRFSPYAADETWLRSRVAEILGLKIPTVHSRLRAARDQLRRAAARSAEAAMRRSA